MWRGDSRSGGAARGRCVGSRSNQRLRRRGLVVPLPLRSRSETDQTAQVAFRRPRHDRRRLAERHAPAALRQHVRRAHRGRHARDRRRERTSPEVPRLGAAARGQQQTPAGEMAHAPGRSSGLALAPDLAPGPHAVVVSAGGTRWPLASHSDRDLAAADRGRTTSAPKSTMARGAAPLAAREVYEPAPVKRHGHALEGGLAAGGSEALLTGQRLSDTEFAFTGTAAHPTALSGGGHTHMVLSRSTECARPSALRLPQPLKRPSISDASASARLPWTAARMAAASASSSTASRHSAAASAGRRWISPASRRTGLPIDPPSSSCATPAMNMLRIGGTMFYEANDFYDLCDELGNARVAGLHVRQHGLPRGTTPRSPRTSVGRQIRCSSALAGSAVARGAVRQQRGRATGGDARPAGQPWARHALRATCSPPCVGLGCPRFLTWPPRRAVVSCRSTSTPASVTTTASARTDAALDDARRSQRAVRVRVPRLRQRPRRHDDQILGLRRRNSSADPPPLEGTGAPRRWRELGFRGRPRPLCPAAVPGRPVDAAASRSGSLPGTRPRRHGGADGEHVCRMAPRRLVVSGRPGVVRPRSLAGGRLGYHRFGR